MGRASRWGPLLAVVALLAAAAVAASTGRIGLSDVEPADVDELDLSKTHEPVAPMTASPSPEPVALGMAMPPWLTWVMVALGATVAVLVVAVVLRVAVQARPRFRRRALPRRPLPTVAPQTETDVVAAVDAGLRDLDDDDGDPRRAVIACWVRLEQAAAAAGTDRLPGDTSTDLVLRLLSGHRLSEPVLSGFAEVYRQARYAPRREIDDLMRHQARAALVSLRAELSGVPA